MKAIVKIAILGCICTSALQAQQSAMPGTQAEFWNQQRKGANMFNAHPVTPTDFEAAAEYGIAFIRLSPNKYTNGRPKKEKGNFLLGPKEKPVTVPVAADLKLLIAQLDAAEKAHEKVIVTLLSLPYSRWSQHNKGIEERAMWNDFKKQDSAIVFLQNLALAIKDHPAVVGLNLRNEPSPERTGIPLKDWYTGDYVGWEKEIRDTPQDLNQFYAKAVAAIRKVAPELLLVLDSGFHAQPHAFKILKPILNDPAILYSFHLYSPWPFPYSDAGKYRYPGLFETGEEKGAAAIYWDKNTIETFLKPVRDWQKQYGIPDNRILVGEFGVNRHGAGAEVYLKDLITVFNAYHWHWAFYSFREDEWDIMDYELGAGRTPASYWENQKSGKPQDYSKTVSNPLFDVIRADLKR